MRGDLDVLAARGEVRRIRGGAISHDAPVAPPEGEDDGIGRAAAGLLRDGECAFVGAGALGLARALARDAGVRDAVVVTNGLDVAGALAGAGYEVVVTGGTVSGRRWSTRWASCVTARLNADVAFVACAAVALGGATDGGPARGRGRRGGCSRARRGAWSSCPAAGVGRGARGRRLPGRRHRRGGDRARPRTRAR